MSAPADERVLAGAPRLDFDRLRADVEALAAMERGSAAELKPHVAWLRTQLRDAGAHDVRTESFAFQSRWIWRHGAHVAAGVGAAVAGGPAGAALAGATLASFELEVAGRGAWPAPSPPGGGGINVLARIPAAGPAERTVVFPAPHDAARTGLLWRLPRTRKP